MVTEEPSDRQSPPPIASISWLGNWAVAHGVTLLTVGGVIAYALGRSCYIVFYSAFGISPDEVGIDQARSVETAGLLLLAAGIAAFSLSFAVGSYLRPGWRQVPGVIVVLVPYFYLAHRADQLGDNGFVSTAGVVTVIIALVLLETGLRLALGSKPPPHWKLNAVRTVAVSLVLIIGGCLVTAWQFGVRAAREGTFAASPFSAIRVDPVCVAWIGPPAESPIARRHVYLRLGSADGVVVLYDRETRSALRIPQSNIAMATSRIDHKATCA